MFFFTAAPTCHLEASSISRKVKVGPNSFDSGDPPFSLRKLDAALALGDAREVRDILWTPRQFHGCRYDRCGLGSGVRRLHRFDPRLRLQIGATEYVALCSVMVIS
jgi:hypothetical protein